MNNKANKSYAFCIEYNLKTNESTTKKIFETAKKKDPIAFFKSEKFNYAGFVSAHGSANPKFNYLITNMNNEPQNYGVEVGLPNLKKASITDFLVGKNGELVMSAIHTTKNNKGGLFAKKKDQTNDVFILRKGGSLKQVSIPSDEIHSKYVMFLGAEDNIKTAFLTGSKNDGYTNLVTADLDLNSGRAINQNSMSYKDLSLNNENKKPYRSKRKQKKQKKKAEKKAKRILNITNVQVAPDGTTNILLEEAYSITETRTRSTSGGGMSSTTSTRYYYGPGKMVLLDKDNSFIKTADLDYKIIFFNYDPGVGLDFLPLNDENIVVKTSKFFTQYDLNRDKVKISRKGDSNRGLRNLIKAFKGKGEAFKRSKNKLYLIDIEHRTKLRFSSFDL